MPSKSNISSLENKLKASKFRWLNEKLYTTTGDKSLSHFKANPELFTQYHEGFSMQVGLWSVNPLDLIIDELLSYIDKRAKLLAPLVIADLGCGEGKLGTSLSLLGVEVYSFDLVSTQEHIIAADISNIPLSSSSVDIAVFCLSLMGTNWPDFIDEALRILKEGGFLYIAEVRSRFDSGIKPFVDQLQNLGLKLLAKDEKNSYFINFKFVKEERRRQVKCKISTFLLKPCIYKRR
ncbi:25S rRNA (adenine645-N1)-methyltransferase [Mitosporidium daphniae]